MPGFNGKFIFVVDDVPLDTSNGRDERREGNEYESTDDFVEVDGFMVGTNHCLLDFEVILQIATVDYHLGFVQCHRQFIQCCIEVHNVRVHLHSGLVEQYVQLLNVLNMFNVFTVTSFHQTYFNLNKTFVKDEHESPLYKLYVVLLFRTSEE